MMDGSSCLQTWILSLEGYDLYFPDRPMPRYFTFTQQPSERVSSACLKFAISPLPLCAVWYSTATVRGKADLAD